MIAAFSRQLDTWKLQNKVKACAVLKLIRDGVWELVKPELYKETTESKHGFDDADPSEVEELRKLAGLSSPPTIRNSPQRRSHNLPQNYSALHLLSESLNNVKTTQSNNLVQRILPNKSDVGRIRGEVEISR